MEVGKRDATFEDQVTDYLKKVQDELFAMATMTDSSTAVPHSAISQDQSVAEAASTWTPLVGESDDAVIFYVNKDTGGWQWCLKCYIQYRKPDPRGDICPLCNERVRDGLIPLKEDAKVIAS